MAKGRDKKSLLILLIILGLVLIACAWWLFSIVKPKLPTQDLNQDLQVQKVYNLKEIALDNIEKFIGMPGKPNSIFENLYNDPQYKKLEELEINIDITDGIGNNYPFASSTPNAR